LFLNKNNLRSKSIDDNIKLYTLELTIIEVNKYRISFIINLIITIITQRHKTK